jgi:hypothetical protein
MAPKILGISGNRVFMDSDAPRLITSAQSLVMKAFAVTMWTPGASKISPFRCNGTAFSLSMLVRIAAGAL